VNAVFDDSELEHEVMAFAREMAANSAWSLRTLKRMIFDGLQQSSGAHILEQYRQVNRGDPTVDLSSLRERFRTTKAPS
jgi:enoyl-CoA hydratase/carnithine racemase